MNTFNYRIRGKKEFVKIYAFSRVRNRTVEVATPFVVKSSDWNISRKRLKSNTAENKAMNIELTRLQEYLNECSLSHCGVIDKQVFANWIDKFINPNPGLKKINIVEFTERYVLSDRVLRYETRRSYRDLVNRIKEFDKISGFGSISITEIKPHLMHDFVFWFREHRGIKQATIYSYIKLVKAILNRAFDLGYAIDARAIKFRTPSYFPDERSDMITLNREEISAIESLNFEESHPLCNSWKWFVVGLQLGQRVSDLLALTPTQIRFSKDNFLYVDIVQQKTGAAVTIPVASSLAIEILRSKNFFPKKVFPQAFNNDLKEICRLAEINETITAYMSGPGNKKILVTAPKFRFVSSHIMRRSFATRHYGTMPNTLIMKITGHKKEQTFLTYVNAQLNKDLYADSFIEHARKAMNV